MFSPQTHSPKNITFAASLLLAFLIGLPDKQAKAQFRFKSSYGQQSSRSRSTASRYSNSNRSSDQRQNAVRRSSTTTGNIQRIRKTSSQAQRLTSSLEPKKSGNNKSGNTVSRFQPSKIKSQPKPTRESWSRADQILGNSNKSRVRSETPRRPSRSESGFSTKDFEEAKYTNRDIFPGERRPGSRAADFNKTESKSSAKASGSRSPVKLSDIIADRISGRGTSTRESEQAESSGRERPDQADLNHIDVAQDRGAKTETADPPRSPIGGGNIFDGIGDMPGREDYQNHPPEDSGDDTDPQAPAPTPIPQEETDPQDNIDGETPDYDNQNEGVEEVECRQKIREIILDVLDRVGPGSAPMVVAPSVEPSIIVQPVVVQPHNTGSEAVPEGSNTQNSNAQGKRKIRTDLEVVGVKFVDFGNKKENTGPKFKIEVRNHNNKFSAESVSIAVIAAIDFKDDLLGRTAVEANIESIPPRGTAAIDVQLSREAYELISGKGQTAIFAELAVIADPEQQFIDVRPENNVWVQDIDDIEMEE